MAKFKITVLDTVTGEVKSEIIESTIFPCPCFPSYSGASGIYGVPIKVEMLLEAASENTIDVSETGV